MTTNTLEDLLQETKGRLDNLLSSAPKSVHPLDISPTAKTPYKIIIYREGVYLRVLELANSAFLAFQRIDIVTGILLTRSVIETVAALWYTKNLLNKPVNDDTDSKVMQLLSGHRNKPDMPQAVNVLSFLDAIEKEIKGIKDAYNLMSEYAHPNWAGVMLLYSKPDPITYITYFGKNIRDPNPPALMGLDCLIGALEMFEYIYNLVGDFLPQFIANCENHLAQKSGKKS